MDPNFFVGLFNIGIAKLSNVNRLENIIDQLEEIDESRRILFLTPIDETQSDYSTFINGPWVTSRHSEDFDAADVARHYRRIAKKTKNWGIPSLSRQCSVAQAIMLDEYQNDKEGALTILEKASALACSLHPDPASSLNQVERFFADLTEKQIRRGVHRSTADLERAITEYIETVNEDPKPFRWHKTVDEILAFIKRFCLRTLKTAAATVT